MCGNYRECYPFDAISFGFGFVVFFLFSSIISSLRKQTKTKEKKTEYVIKTKQNTIFLNIAKKESIDIYG